jgi:hypothetical protein
VRFGVGRIATAAVEPAPSEAAPPYEYAAVEMLTVDGRRAGWIATDGARTSDWLNQAERVAVYGLTDADLGASAPPSLPTATSDLLSLGDVVWVVPPPLPPNRHLRLHRRRVRVHLELDGHHIVGQVHVRPGAEASDSILRGARTLVPLTDVEVASRTDPADRVLRPVLIVNVTHVRRLVSDGPKRLPAVAAPAPSSPPPSIEPSPPAPVARRIAPDDDTATALRLLLDEGIIDVTEFQVMRARIAPAHRP